MALGDWASITVNERGEPTSRRITAPDGVVFELRKNFIRVLESGEEVAQLSAGHLGYRGTFVEAHPLPTQDLSTCFIVETTDGRLLAGLGCFGDVTPDMRDRARERVAFADGHGRYDAMAAALARVRAVDQSDDPTPEKRETPEP